jgi:hypothetical protein
MPDTPTDVDVFAPDYYLAPDLKLDLTSLRAMFDKGNAETTAVHLSDVTVDLVESKTLTFKTYEDNTFQVPANSTGLTHLANWLDVPYKFLLRQDRDFQQLILERLLARNPGEVLLEWSDEQGIVALRDTGVEVIDPRRIIDIAAKVLDDPYARVTRAFSTEGEYRFDVVMRTDDGIFGDRQVGDLTAAGLTFGQNTKANLAPWVQPYAQRLVCTNGMVSTDPSLKVDGRGKDVSEMLAHLEAQAQRAFARMEHEIDAFYDLRNQRVVDSSQTLLRLAREQGLPERIVFALIERMPVLVDDTQDVSMFDLVNVITNHANAPELIGKAKPQRALEAVGGQIILSHAERCPRCHSALAH